MTPLQQFTGLSAVLTGFAESKIAPSIDPINVKEEYFAAWTVKTGATLSTSILNQYAALKAVASNTFQMIGEQMLDASNGADFVLACRKLIFLWYSGAWPTLSADGKSTSSVLLSTKSYNAGLVWQVMQSHPMGSSNYRYGYWSEEPAPLNSYLGNPNK